jgi:DNA ligase-1
MTLVKPPTFDELVKTYGSPKEAVVHLAKVGFTPEQIERKFHIPYFFIQLSLAGLEPKNLYPFSNVVSIFDKILTLRSIKGKETELTRFFQIKELSFETKVRLALGQIIDANPKVGPSIVEKAIAEATGKAQDTVRKLFLDYGDYGDVASLLLKEKPSKLTVDEVYNSIKLLPNLKGIDERIHLIASILQASTPSEGKYIIRLILQDLKLGYHEPSVKYAVARVLGIDKDLLEQACSVMGVTGALLLALKGNKELSKVKLRPGRFIPPQLAHLYDPDKVQFPVRIEYKYDGSRLQIHKWGTQVWLFSRRAVEKSKTLPEIANLVKEFNAHSCIVDGEVVAIDLEGNLLPFQDLLVRTVPREYEEKRAKEIGLTFKAFDILYLNERNLMGLPLRERREYLKMVVPEKYLASGTDCTTEHSLMEFYQTCLDEGLEGVVVKNLNSVYEPGERTYTWLKLKPERDTLDCVVVKALYGKGHRAGFYSSLLLAVRDPFQKKLYTIGKVSNISEEMMANFRGIIERTKIREDEEGVYVKPSIVLEVTFQEIQKTDEYTSGFALRVPKYVRIRDDKSVNEIDTIEKVHKLYEIQYEERYKAKDIS